MHNNRKIALMFGATICFALNGIAFAQAGSGGAGGQSGAGSAGSQSGAGSAGSQSGAGSQSRGAGSQTGAGSGSTAAGSGAHTGTAGQSAGNMSSGSAASSGGSHNMSAGADHKFAEAAAAGSAAEIQLGQMASQKATNEKVKQFAQRMVTDHTKASDELKSLASKKGMTLMDTPKPKDTATMSKLEKMSGAGFDKAYMQDMVKDHQKDVAEFQKEANSGSDPDLKAFAGTTLPILQEHLRMAKEALSAVSGGAAGGSSQSSGQ